LLTQLALLHPHPQLLPLLLLVLLLLLLLLGTKWPHTTDCRLTSCYMAVDAYEWRLMVDYGHIAVQIDKQSVSF
jgi:hypothetical protein